MARFNAELQAALAKTSWGAGGSSWYKTGEGKITNNGSSRTASYWLCTRKPDFDELDIG
jgi:hypothetical protein